MPVKGNYSACLTAVSWLYLLAVLGMWGGIWFGADRWWWASVVSFGPRWVAGLPLALLVPIAMLQRRRLLLPLLMAGMVVASPIVGLCVPWRSLLPGHGRLPSDRSVSTIRVLTCNVGSGVDVGQLASLVQDKQPDLVALQEWSGAVEIPEEMASKWQVARHRGLCILSRFPITRSIPLDGPEFGRWPDAGLRCDLETPQGEVHFFCLHLTSPREGLQEVINRGWDGASALEETTAQRRTESDLARRWIDEAPSPVLIAGDFNMPVDAGLYRRDWSGFSNAFTMAGLGWGWTKYTRYFGIRIDHILADDEWQILSCWVDPSLGGDHRPVLADFLLRDGT
jgi:vancomycin resistance protein VanJ